VGTQPRGVFFTRGKSFRFQRSMVNGQPEELLILMEGGSLHWVARAG
jgi:hypothetical protein